jgi:plastocyanin
MITRTVIALVLSALVFVPSGAGAQQPSEVPCTPDRICFGRDVGSPFPPPSGHDQSNNARDNIVPRNVTVPVGTSVNYLVTGPHYPAIYDVGTAPADIDTTAFPPAPGCPPVPTIHDTDGQLWETAGCPPSGSVVTAPGSIFDQPGRYLVICQIKPHFETGMWGWVTVR